MVVRSIRLFGLIALMVLTGCVRQPVTPPEAVQAEIERWQAQASRVEIIRDQFGVPHVYGQSDADAVFGLLYAHAEDDFPRIEQNYIWATGRLAEVEGRSGLASDIRARLFMTVDEAKSALAAAPPWLQALCQAFADGLNFYLYSHPEVKPRLITRFEPWMPLFFSEGSIGGDIEQVPLAGIEAFYGLDNDQQGLVHVGQGLGDLDLEPRGSNGIAIAKPLTANGHSLLLINPHTSFYFRGEAHVVSEEGLNAYGGVTWGQFFIYQGFNEKTGWMHTSTRLDFMDEFLEEIVVQDGQRLYRYGDELRPVITFTETFGVMTKEGLVSQAIDLHRTHHGPVTGQQGDYWIATAMNWDPVPALEQSFVRTKQTDLSGFLTMMNIRKNSSNNTVFADADGNIAYFHGNFVPRRSSRFDYSHPVLGSDPDTDWQGIHEIDELVRVINPINGWVQNCNSTPASAAGAHSPKLDHYPSYMAPDPENFRGLHAVALLEGSSNWTLEGLIAAAYDPNLPAFKALIPGLVQAVDGSPELSSDVVRAASLLANWDYTASVDSIPLTLAHFYGMHYLRDGQRPAGYSELDLLTHFGITSDPSERLKIFTQTLKDLTDRYGQWDLPWGAVNRLQRLTGDILQPHDDLQPSLPIGLASGRWGALASFGSKRFEGTQKLYGSSGNSFVAAVEFGPKLRAKSLLAGGQSGDPASPHFFDQALAYQQGKFKDVAFYREDVESQATRRYQPGNEKLSR